MFAVQVNPESSHDWATVHGVQTIDLQNHLWTRCKYFNSNFEFGK